MGGRGGTPHEGNFRFLEWWSNLRNMSELIDESRLGGSDRVPAVPDEPILFTKSPNTLVGPYDDVRIPRGAWLQPGDVMELGVDGRGAQRQHVIGAR
jgi:2-keto-4-pentenoate hydratase/2-oxohepta-3-ene-1,7-dioic acid hydratase in catechol pathway